MIDKYNTSTPQDTRIHIYYTCIELTHETLMIRDQNKWRQRALRELREVLVYSCEFLNVQDAKNTDRSPSSGDVKKHKCGHTCKNHQPLPCPKLEQLTKNPKNFGIHKFYPKHSGNSCHINKTYGPSRGKIIGSVNHNHKIMGLGKMIYTKVSLK